MIKSFIRFALLLLIINQIIPCDALRGFGRGSYGGKYGSKGYKEPQAKTYAGTGASQGFAGQSATRRGLGISAWGIVTLVVSCILAIVGLYYISICYPVICQKNKKYDIMGLTSVV
ncbi:hypothetical protein RR46_02648 [Papilio xuthus]|uniref:Uncharacterized protein n=1 Tax=Papilio xuthus TaxID=66420 RepID=A0A194Q5H5_PAPXU|nr:hypothetical protein RR46_02648 [Papilio xuthus]